MYLSRATHVIRFKSNFGKVCLSNDDDFYDPDKIAAQQCDAHYSVPVEKTAYIFAFATYSDR